MPEQIKECRKGSKSDLLEEKGTKLMDKRGNFLLKERKKGDGIKGKAY